MTKKRYIASVDYYVYANSDKEAIEMCKLKCKEQDANNDDKCALLSIIEQPFGTFSTKIIYKNDK